MELQIIGHNVEILPTVRSYVEKKLGKINRHLPNVKTVKIELMELKARATKFRFRAQVTLEADGLLLRAEEQAENLLVAIDKVVPVLDRQIERYKGKYSRKSPPGSSIKNQLQEEPVTEKGDAPAIVRTKRFSVRLMTTQEAVEQMELLGHDFFLFNNAATKELNLLYRRKDGNYSIIEPEIK
ncbi:MAG: ribosome-associated translation inhibitor RaiA [Dehalococcoidales bacterium]|nr:ribosome-associated translation inhibitor RaiA [Dehalococcoidales bacterium]